MYVVDVEGVDTDAKTILPVSKTIRNLRHNEMQYKKVTVVST